MSKLKLKDKRPWGKWEMLYQEKGMWIKKITVKPGQRLSLQYHLKRKEKWTIINQRCNNKKNNKYHRYGGRGIKNLLTKSDIKYLWFRDKAYLMKIPSIDKKKNDNNYSRNNCQFLELGDNSHKGTK